MSSSTIRMLYRGEKCDAMSPGQQKFVDHNNKKLNATMTVLAERQRSNRFYIRKMTTFRGCNMILFSHTRFMEYVNPTQFFFYTQIQSFQIQPKKIKINEVWNSANALFKWSFWFVVIQKFCSHGNMMWRLFLTIEQNTSTAHIAPTQRYLSKREIAHSLWKHLPGCNKIKHINFSDI